MNSSRLPLLLLTPLHFLKERLKKPPPLLLCMTTSLHLTFRALIEVIGKPKEHVEQAMKQYIDNLKSDERFKVLHEEFAEIKKHDQQDDLWATFTELELNTNTIEHLIDFCFDYMPSLIEILEPEQLTIGEKQLSFFLNDLQAKLHQVDMVAKQVKLENDTLKKNIGGLLHNYIKVLLGKADSLSAKQLSTLTGVEQDQLEDFMDKLIDKNIIDLKNGQYYLVEKAPLTEKKSSKKP